MSDQSSGLLYHGFVRLLDHGFVRLVDSMPRENGDLAIVRAARVSYDADWRTGVDEGKDTKLIHYLWRNKHTSPFEAVTFTLEVQAPIFVFRQWQRHRTQSYNELSARYTELPEVFYTPEIDQIGLQSKSNKQARTQEGNENSEHIARAIMHTNALSFQSYRHLLAQGCPRELARSVLPLGTYSRMFTTVNLCNLFHFLMLRCDSHAQYEIRVYAEAMRELIRPIVPVALAAWEAQHAS